MFNYYTSRLVKQVQKQFSRENSIEVTLETVQPVSSLDVIEEEDEIQQESPEDAIAQLPRKRINPRGGSGKRKLQTKTYDNKHVVFMSIVENKTATSAQNFIV
mgnify:CR=1 FL=1